MLVNGKSWRTIWREGDAVGVIDQTRLPHAFTTMILRTGADAARAIADMVVRGAPLIGATAAYGMALAMRQDASDEGLDSAARLIAAARPTAVNLAWAVERVRCVLQSHAARERVEITWKIAKEIADEDVAINVAIGENAAKLLRSIAAAKSGPLNILTHCNAGWLATVDRGTATAPLYQLHDEGLHLHVYVDETRPRNQGASLTAWELGQHGVPHTLIADNAGGHLMRCGMVDAVIVGTDRTAANGDVCNKIGTYLKALAAHDNNVPFLVALPSPTIDWALPHGDLIPIEERSPREQTHITGRAASGEIIEVQLAPDGTMAGNWGFDVTPARLVTHLVTERGVCAASREGLLSLFPERSA